MDNFINTVEKIKNVNINNNINILTEFRLLLEKNASTIKEIISKENNFLKTNYEYNKIFHSFDNIKNYDFEQIKKYSSIGRIVCITNGDIYFILELIIKSILTKSKIVFVTDSYMINTNKYLVGLAQKALEKYDVPNFAISLFDLRNYKEVLNVANNIDCIVINKDYDLYKEIQYATDVKVIYSDYGNINIYSDSDEFDIEIKKVYDEAKKEEKDVFLSKTDDIQKYINKMNNNFVFYSVVIYTKDIEKCTYFLKNIKAENVYINQNPFEINDIEFSEFQFLYKKKIKISWHKKTVVI